MDPIATARYGLMAAQTRFEASATKIAGNDGDAGDLAEGIVGLTEAKTAFKANVAVIRFEDDMWDSLLSIQSDDHK